jgi:hypothetical protein
VYCIERRARCALWTGLAGLSLLAGCSTTSTGGSQAESAATPRPAARVSSSGGTPAPTLGVPPGAGLPPPGTVRNWSEVRLQAARRLVSANPASTYMGTVPDILLAIPVLEVELHADGSIRRIDVLRKPTQALDTIKLATDALYRAAPFGDVSRLPKPWRFTETFLFDDDRKFKPRTLDQ